ncbi:MAG: aldose 1-epimerase family protein [Eubacteriales bacterium]
MHTTADSFLIKSGDLTAVIARRGGELRSLCDRETEWIWQGDPAYWSGSAPLLFPFCGRVKEGVYRWQGQNYPMPIHGFLSEAKLTATEYSEDSLTLTLADTPETRAIYPFAFGLSLCYHLSANALSLTATVTAGDTGLPFSFGAHPGFRLPFGENGFGDAFLRFDSPAPLTRVVITENGLLGDGRVVFPLRGNDFPLSPDLAGGCGIFFEVAEGRRAVTLSASALPRDLRVEFADFPVLGLWHAEGAPYLCIEPWQGLPAPADAPTDLANKPATVCLAPAEQKQFDLRIILQQKGNPHV